LSTLKSERLCRVKKLKNAEFKTGNAEYEKRDPQGRESSDIGGLRYRIVEILLTESSDIIPF